MLSLGVGTIFSCSAIYLAFKNTPLVQLSEFIKTIDFRWIVFSTILAILTLFIKGFRWMIIVRPIKKINFWHAYHPVVLSVFINMILPGRLGELARPVILYRNDDIAFSKGLATVGLERMLDILTLLVIFMGSIQIETVLSFSFNGYEINQATLLGVRTKLMYMIGIFFVGIVAMMFSTFRKCLGTVIAMLPHLFWFTSQGFRERASEKLTEKAQQVLTNIALGFEIIRKPHMLVYCFILTIMVWLLVFCSFYALVLGCKGVHLSFLQASTSVIILCFFIMLPSVPGFWGIWEIGGLYGLMIFGVPRIEASGLTLAFHFFQIMPVIFAGIISSWLTGMNIMNVYLPPKGNNAMENT